MFLFLASVGRAGCLAFMSCVPWGGHSGLGAARGDADADGEASGGAAALLPIGQAGRAEDHPHQQGLEARRQSPHLNLLLIIPDK